MRVQMIQTPEFELSRGDKNKIRSLLSQTRDMIANADCFDDPHKRRLLARVSQVETEIFKPKGSLDTILAGIVDFGEAIGIAGEKARPMFDRICEIRGIAQSKTPDYKQLPPPDEMKRLLPPSRKLEAEPEEEELEPD